MIWGYAHVWFGEFLTLDAEPQLARLKFIRKWGSRRSVSRLPGRTTATTT